MKIEVSQLAQNIDQELLQKFIEAGVFYGRKKTLTSPKMKEYLINLPTLGNIEIFNLDKTKELLDRAAQFMSKLIKEGEKILFVGTKPAANYVKEVANFLGQYWITFRWPGGFLTNFVTIKSRIDFLKSLEEKIKSGEIEKYPPKEKIAMQREYEKLIKMYEGVKDMERLPGAIFIVDLSFKNHKTAHREALKMKIPIIAICGSDNDPEGVEYIIPANDKAPRSIKFLLDYLKESIKI